MERKLLISGSSEKSSSRCLSFGFRSWRGGEVLGDSIALDNVGSEGEATLLACSGLGGGGLRTAGKRVCQASRHFVEFMRWSK